MILGHVPAGYLAATAALDRAGVEGGQRQWLLAVALVASVAPDLDLLYFYAVDGSVHHHSFPTHWPLTWIAGAGVGLLVAAARRSPFLALASVVAGAAGLLHLALDTVAGAVRWGAPFSDRAYTLVDVPASHEWWVASMVLHWTFAVEVALVMAAGVVAWRRRRPTPPSSR